MPDEIVLAAQKEREDRVFNEYIADQLDVLLSAKTVGPEARAKLHGLLAHYAKEPHPFRACVRDNMKRFGPGRTEQVCATLKDIIRGTTHWRKGGNHSVAASNKPHIDPDVEQLLLSISEEDIDRLIEGAMRYA